MSCLPFLPACQVTIVPREKHPLGQTVVKANEDRELTGLFTRRYLEEQLLTVLAGRAGELGTDREMGGRGRGLFAEKWRDSWRGACG